MLIGIWSSENGRIWHFNADVKMLRKCRESAALVKTKRALATKVLIMSMFKIPSVTVWYLSIKNSV